MPWQQWVLPWGRCVRCSFPALRLKGCLDGIFHLFVCLFFAENLPFLISVFQRRYSILNASNLSLSEGGWKAGKHGRWSGGIHEKKQETVSAIKRVILFWAVLTLFKSSLTERENSRCKLKLREIHTVKKTRSCDNKENYSEMIHWSAVGFLWHWISKYHFCVIFLYFYFSPTWWDNNNEFWVVPEALLLKAWLHQYEIPPGSTILWSF